MPKPTQSVPSAYRRNRIITTINRWQHKKSIVAATDPLKAAIMGELVLELMAEFEVQLTELA